MNFHAALTKLATYKKPIVMTAVILLAFTLTAVLGYMTYHNRNYLIDRFAPQSRIDFTVYTPHQRSSIRKGLVISDYLKQTGDRSQPGQVQVIMMDVEHPGWDDITEQKASPAFHYECVHSSKVKCMIRHTKKDQQYIHTTRNYGRDADASIEEWVQFNKGGTNLLLHRKARIKEAVTTEELDNYIDSLIKLPKNQLENFWFISDKPEPLGI